MRILVIILVLFGSIQVTMAQEITSLDSLRTEARNLLNQTRQFLLNTYTEIRTRTGMSDEELFMSGVGLGVGFLFANIVGAGGVLTLVSMGAGAYVGKVIATDIEEED